MGEQDRAATRAQNEERDDEEIVPRFVESIGVGADARIEKGV